MVVEEGIKMVAEEVYYSKGEVEPLLEVEEEGNVLEVVEMEMEI